MKKTLLAAMVSVLAAPTLALAAPITIDISIDTPTTLTATGSFEFDAGTNTYSDFNVFLDGTLGPLTFTNEACDGCPLSGSGAGLIDPTLVQTSFVSDFEVTFRSGLVDLFFRGDSVFLEEASGRVEGTYALAPEATPVPEPASVLLFGGGLLGLAAMRRRRV